MKQYPYILKKLVIPESTRDSQGNLQGSTETWEVVCNCRNEDAKQRRFNLSESNYLNATHLIQCPKGTAPIQAGVKIRIENQDGTERLRGQVIYSEQKQLHTQIWV